jgi:TIR domain
MASLAEPPGLVGFFSYSRSDDEHSGLALSQLRGRIYNELRLQLGRRVRLWQDTAAIPHGTLWEQEIRRAINESSFFIPIVTPSAVSSPQCKFEFEAFLKRESELLRNDLVFPYCIFVFLLSWTNNVGTMMSCWTPFTRVNTLTGPRSDRMT